MRNWIFAFAWAWVGMGCTEQSTEEPQSQTQTLSSEVDSETSETRRPPPGPPPEAFEACSDKAEGDACTVQLRDESIAGHCARPPQGVSETRLACRPDNPPKGGPPRRANGGGAPCDDKEPSS